jgi:predicted phosphodiesterase
MPEFIRIFSDIHYGDRASQVHALAQLTPLLQGPSALVLNGDTLDTRLGPAPQRTEAMREEVQKFFPQQIAAVTFLTGNHDANFSTHHQLELAGGALLLTHGDILFDDIVPWSQDAPFIRARLAEEFQKLPAAQLPDLETRLAVFRRVAIGIPQRHQSERNAFKYAADLARDTIWPPTRFLQIIQAWREMPARAEALLRAHRPQAKFLLVGHTHRPGVWRRRDGIVIINTGSFSRPFGACLVDLWPTRVVVRRIVSRHGEFHPGRVLAEFALAEA